MSAIEPAEILLVLPPSIGHPDRFESLGIAYLVAALRRAGRSVRSVNLSSLLYRLDRELYQRVYEPTCLEHFYRRGVWGDDTAYLERLLSGHAEPSLKEKTRAFAELAAKKIAEASPRLVGISVLQSNILFSAALARCLAAAKIPVVVGGPGAREAAMQKFLFRHGCRCILVGEAEAAISPLVEDFVEGGRLPPAGSMISCGKIENLDSLPYPDFDTEKPLSWLPVAASRGCVCRCLFCEETRFFGGLRKRDAAKVVAEIKENLGKFRARGVQFHDSLINFDNRWLSRFCRLLCENFGAIDWQAYARPADMPDGLIELIKACGCSELSFGVEHFSQKMSDRLGKRLDVAQAYRVLERTAAAGVVVKVLLITGVPGETEADHAANLDALEKLLVAHPGRVYFSVNPLIITPNSAYFRAPQKFGVSFARNRKGQVVSCEFLQGPDRKTVMRRLRQLLALMPTEAR